MSYIIGSILLVGSILGGVYLAQVKGEGTGGAVCIVLGVLPAATMMYGPLI